MRSGKTWTRLYGIHTPSRGWKRGWDMARFSRHGYIVDGSFIVTWHACRVVR